ncbi:Hpt domain-containing protein [Frigidibacter sp. ROC022]|uniref:Hpt domain-containing protein n=1 Tax=Frigidibacter sp. ROC022 TaxID=2971796 RepID=UPI00215B6AC1|nr:Hpt domain-containing protein [Frigidibacter sp. ROC022]MCR8726088.1 Hpt domain-containing protein [Frigidibacter sp. ROC022]
MNSLAHKLPGIARIRERFLEMHDERHDALEDALTLISSGEDCQQALLTARDILHKIAGSAGSLGFADLGEAAGKAETVVQEHIDTNFRDQTPVTEELDRFLELSITYCSTTAE